MPYCSGCGRELPADSQFCPHCGRNLSHASFERGQSLGGYDSDASVARSLALAAIILQLVFFLLGFFILIFMIPAFYIGSVTVGTFNSQPYQTGAGPAFPFFGIFYLIFGIAFGISIVWVALDYFLVYRNLESSETMPIARTAAIILGVLQLIFGGFIPGALLIASYFKINDSMQRRGLSY